MKRNSGVCGLLIAMLFVCSSPTFAELNERVKPRKSIYTIPDEQKEFQRLIASIPKIPDIAGTRQEEIFLAKTNKKLGDYELVDLGVGNFDVQPKTGKTGLTSITGWICKTSYKHEDGEDFGSCDSVGISRERTAEIFWNSGSNFNPNKKYYVGDVLKVSGKVKSLAIYDEFGSWSYKIELIDGDFEVIHQGK